METDEFDHGYAFTVSDRGIRRCKKKMFLQTFLASSVNLGRMFEFPELEVYLAVQTGLQILCMYLPLTLLVLHFLSVQTDLLIP